MQQINGFLRHAMGKALIAPGKTALLCEFLLADGAQIPPAPVVERRPLAPQIQIPYRPLMIIMDAAGRRPARRTQVLLLPKFDRNCDFPLIFLHVFQNDVFHVQQHCDIIFRRQGIPLQVVDCRIFILPVRAYFVFLFGVTPQLLL